MVGILAERGLDPTPTEATALALGIHEDTGSLTHLTTTVRDIEALAWCVRHGAGQELIAEFLRTPLSGDQRELLTALMESAETHQVAGIPVLIAAARWPHHIAAVSTLASKIVELTDVRVLVMLVEMDGRVFVVGRSRTPVMDVCAVLEGLGGGGHAPAASAIVRDRDLEDVRAAVLAELPAGVTSGARARDIMSAPAWFIDHEVTVEQAMAECRRRQTSGVQVEADGRAGGCGCPRGSRPRPGSPAWPCAGTGGDVFGGRHHRSRRDPDRGAARDREGAGRTRGGGCGCRRRPPGRGRRLGSGHSYRPLGRSQPAPAGTVREPRDRGGRGVARPRGTHPAVGGGAGRIRRCGRRLPGGRSGARPASGRAQLRHRSGCGGRWDRLRRGARRRAGRSHAPTRALSHCGRDRG